MIELERDAPDLEDLAAYLDGLLSGERKAQVEERLLRDEDYYEVYLENVRFQEEQAEVDGDRSVVSGPAAWWRPRRAALIVPLAVAAVAAVLVAVIGLWRLNQGPTTAEWVAQLDTAEIVSREDWAEPGWTVLRNSPNYDLLREQERAFRIGTRTVDLQVALAARNREAALNPARYLNALISADDFLFPLSGFSLNLQESIDSEDLDVLSTQVAELDGYLADSFEHSRDDRYSLGAWNEAGRLAAMTKDAKALTRVWRRRKIAQGIDKIAPYLKTLEMALEQPDPDFDAAREAFSGIAKALAGRA